MRNTMLLLALAWGSLAMAADKKEKETVRLYQVGQDGKYCLSLAPDPGGCVSGIDEQKNVVNILDFIKGKEVVFENLSDSPHDMKFSGNNAEDLPAQEPNGSAVQKQMQKVDMDQQKITCSFHGDMLAVGYRVPEEQERRKPEEKLEGHGKLPGTEATNFAAQNPITAAQPVQKTGLADVSKEIMAKGRPGDVERLVSKQPELINDLAKSRPLLAQEVAAKIPAAAAIIKAPGAPQMASAGGMPQVKGAATADGKLPSFAAMGKKGAASGGTGSSGAGGSVGEGGGAADDSFLGDGLVDLARFAERQTPAERRAAVVAQRITTITAGGPARGLASVEGETALDMSHLRALNAPTQTWSGLWFSLASLALTLVTGVFFINMVGRKKRKPAQHEDKSA